MAFRSLVKANTLAGWRKMFILHLEIFIREFSSHCILVCYFGNGGRMKEIFAIVEKVGLSVSEL